MYHELLGAAQPVKRKGTGSTTRLIFRRTCGMPFSERRHWPKDVQWRGSLIMMTQPPGGFTPVAAPHMHRMPSPQCPDQHQL